MKVYIHGNSGASELQKVVQAVMDELGLTDFIQLEMTNDQALAESLSITQSPALIIEEDSIDFKDMIFEGIIPDESEIHSMFLSIIGGGSVGGSCGSKSSDGSCGTGCSC